MPEVAERYQAPALVRRLLELRTIAVVGLSANPARPSHGVGVYLMNAGYTVIPVNPKESEVLGQRAYPSLLEVPGKVDLVDVFRASDAVPEIAEQAVAIGARGLWLQLGVINSRGIEIAEAGGLDVVVDLCIKIEHARYAA
jgi:predicted CoA-binding protein